ncbi:DUF1176 domain-containing protein [Sphingomonas sp. Leaf25]|uniref:DUF1176 domain-containing protein n=1 Tax=Sphingomonas sp. Leaf25 TaxID=1735692 RepID=UPI0006F80419|nr:DUF1176 domain-containing protein [Sphingomonas sp. Leaf25]KQM97661.1 hypothetical protein ASE78_09850 [Sphingomonas sp. Leaf25]
MRALLSLLLALPLLACGGSTDRDPGGNGATPAPAASSPATVADSRTAPAPGGLKTFTDWTVGCDNGATCQANALMNEDAPAPPVLLSIERAAGPDGAIRVRVQSEGEPRLPLTITVDDVAVVRGGARAGEFTQWTGAPAATIARVIAGGRSAAITGGDGRAIGTLSLTGASAALRWADAQQGRAGTTGALVAKGNRPDDRAAPALSVVLAPTIRGEAALLDPQLVKAMRLNAKCEGEDLPDVTTKALGGGRTLALVPCLTGAYNIVTAVFVVAAGKAVPAAFDTPTVFDGESLGLAANVPFLINVDFTDDVLSSDAKGRGLGDCGIGQRFAWDGARFRLIERREMEECRGSIDFIRTWTVQVVR